MAFAQTLRHLVMATDTWLGRAGRVAMVRDSLDAVTQDDLSVTRRNPWAPSQPESTLSCLHTILDEEWEHHRYAVRDLEAIEAGSDT